MKILFCPVHYIYDEGLEGSELSWSFNIANRLGSRFPGSAVVTARANVRERTASVRIVELMPGASAVRFDVLGALPFNLRYSMYAAKALRQGSFDIVHHVLPFNFGITFNLATLARRSQSAFVIGPVQPPLAVQDVDIDPSNIRSHQSRLHRLASNYSLTASKPVLSLLSRRTLRSCDRVVAVNERTKNLLVAAGVASSQVAVIPPGIDTEKFAPAPGGHTSRSTRRFLALGHLWKRKSVDLLIRAFAEVAAKTPDVELQIVGDGPEMGALRELAQTLGVSDRIEFVGFVANSEVPRYYRDADVFVNASKAETFSTACLEAMASGLPIIGPPVGGFVDAIRDGWNGFLFRDRDHRDVARLMNMLLGEPNVIETLSARARQTAEQRFDWNKAIIPRYVDLYEQARRDGTSKRKIIPAQRASEDVR